MNGRRFRTLGASTSLALLSGALVAVQPGAAALAAPSDTGAQAPTAKRTATVYSVRSTGISESAAKGLADALGLEQYNRSEDGSVRFLDEAAYLTLPHVEGEPGVGEPDESGQETSATAFDFEAIKELQVLDPEKALALAHDALLAAKLLPKRSTSAASHSTFDAVGPDGEEVMTDKAIDTQVAYSFKLDGKALEGPGQKVTLTFDAEGRVTQLTYDVRKLDAAGEVPILTRRQAERRCAEHYGDSAKVSGAQLIYQAPALDQGVTELAPSYRCDATSTSTEGTARPIVVSALLEEPPLPPQEETPRDGAATDGVNGPAGTAGASPDSPQSVFQTDVGVSYIGTSGGLPGSSVSAAGFRNTMAGAGVPTQFFWGDGAAWETDWTDTSVGGNDVSYADDVDLAFYTGHANDNGFTAGGGVGDNFVHYSEVRLGDRSDAEWMSIAACGPLQVGSSPNLWWQRWGPAFQGLHQINGYASQSLDNTIEGPRFADYLTRTPFLWWNQPMSVQTAWAQMAADAQPSSFVRRDGGTEFVRWASMGVFDYRSGVTSFDDYFWGHGPVSPDLRSDLGYWRISGGA